MTRWGRRLLGVALVLTLMTAAGFGLVVALLDPEDLKPRIAAAVEHVTGRALVLRGPVRIGRSLWPTIEVEDASLANLPGGSRPDMARVERVEARLSLPALLRRRLDVTSLTLVGPNILFEFVDGRPNWVFADPEPPRAAGEPASPSGPAIAVRVAGAGVRNGMVTLRLPRRTHVVGIRSLTFRRPAEGGPIEVATELVYQDNASFRMTAAATPTGGLLDPWDAHLAFEAFGARATATGRMSLAGPYDLRAEGTAPALEHLNALLPPLRLPALRDLTFASHLASGPAPGDLPVIGATQLRFAAADLGDRVPGLQLGAVEVALLEAGGTATAMGAGIAAGRAFSFEASIDLPRHLDDATNPPVTLRARATPRPGRPAGQEDGRLDLQGRLALRDAAFEGLDGQVGLRLPALAAWRPLLPAVMPALTDVSLRGRLTLPGDLGALRLRDVALSSDQVEASGELLLGLGARPALEGQLRAARLDLDALLPATTPGAAPVASRADGRVIPDARLPWDWVRGREVALTVQVEALTLHRQMWRHVDLALELAGDRLRLARARLALPAGPAELTLSADTVAAEMPLTLRLRAPGVPLELVARTLGLPGEVEGAVRIEAMLRAQGRGLRDLAASLSGPFSVTMGEGALSNAALIRVASAALEALRIEVPAVGRTAIYCLGVSGAFEGGVGLLHALALDSTHLSLLGRGEVDLAAERLELTLRPLARVVGANVEVPVVVEGPFGAVRGRLEADALDRLGFLLNALTGGDRPRACAEAKLEAERP